jgi:hypothetical protein
VVHFQKPKTQVKVPVLELSVLKAMEKNGLKPVTERPSRLK